MSTDDAPRAAASLLLAREGSGDAGPELLYVQRGGNVRVHPYTWVFPGGKVDLSDQVDDDPETTARRAAVRETYEECAIEVDPESLHPLCVWTTPRGRGRRFVTRFFIAAAPAGPVRVDGDEIVDFAWQRPDGVIALQQSGRWSVSAPSFIFSARLAHLATLDALLAHARSWPFEQLNPKTQDTATGHLALYEGDAGYRSEDAATPGARHRLYMEDGGWRFERSE